MTGQALAGNAQASGPARWGLRALTRTEGRRDAGVTDQRPENAMWDTTPRKILVGVESEDCEAALHVAAAEARRRGCGVHLMHVAHPLFPGSSEVASYVLVADQLSDRGRTALASAARGLEKLLHDDDLSVSTELCHGPVTAMLVEESRHACLVVLQHRGMGHEGLPPLMSVTGGVAGRAHAPVLAVPAHWREELTPEVATVTVAIDDVVGASALLDVALDEAEARGARLRVVQVLGAEDDGADLRDLAALARSGSQALNHQLADTIARRPAVPVEVDVVLGRTVDVLLEESVGTSLLILGRHHPRIPVGGHLGPVVRGLLRWSTMPVLVVDTSLATVRQEAAHSALATASFQDATPGPARSRRSGSTVSSASSTCSWPAWPLG